jgi:hypothetical protein
LNSSENLRRCRFCFFSSVSMEHPYLLQKVSAKTDQAQAPLQDFQVTSAGERYGTRAPVPLLKLARVLEDLALGAVEQSLGCLRLQRASGERAEIRVPASGACVGNVSLKATTPEWAVLCCDALAPTLGPMRLVGGGIEMFIDGTIPRAELETEVQKLLLLAARAIRDELDAPASASAGISRNQYLN